VQDAWTNPLGSTNRQESRFGRRSEAQAPRKGWRPRMAAINPTLSAIHIDKSVTYGKFADSPHELRLIPETLAFPVHPQQKKEPCPRTSPT